MNGKTFICKFCNVSNATSWSANLKHTDRQNTVVLFTHIPYTYALLKILRMSPTHVSHLKCYHVSNTHKTWNKGGRKVVLGMLTFCHCILKAL